MTSDRLARVIEAVARKINVNTHAWWANNTITYNEARRRTMLSSALFRVAHAIKSDT